MQLTVNQALSQAIEAHASGKLQVAEQLYRAILAVQPKHPDANHNLGILCLGPGKAQEALPFLNALIEARQLAEAGSLLEEARKSGLSGEFVKALERKINDIQSTSGQGPGQAGGGPRGETLLRVQLRQEANDLLNCYNAGDLQTAEEKARLLTQRHPDYEFGWKVLGAILKATGRTEESLEPMRQSVRLNPQDSEAHSNLSASLRDLGRLLEAEEVCREAIRIKPDYAVAYSNLGATLGDLGRLAEAEASYREAVRLKPDYAIAHFNLGNTQRDLGKPEVAEASFRRAIHLQPQHAESHYNLGKTLRDLGRLEEAKASLREAIRLQPENAEAHYHLSTLLKYTDSTPHLQQLLKAHGESRSSADTYRLAYALAKAFEDIKDYDQSYRYLSEANRLKHEERAYDLSGERAFLAAVQEIFSGQAVRQPGDLGLSSDKRGIFIVGMHRSGTTLTEQILSSHSKVRAFGELNFLQQAFDEHVLQRKEEGFALPSALKSTYQEYVRKLQEQPGFDEPVFTDKMPLNFKYVGAILEAFPNAKVINTRRDRMAVAWSVYKHYFYGRELDYSDSFETIAQFYKFYEDMMDFWGRRYPNRIYKLNYERLTENQEEETRRLLEFCELPWEGETLKPEENMRAVSTPSSQQVKQGVYQGSSLAWKKYEKHLADLKSLLNYPDGSSGPLR